MLFTVKKYMYQSLLLTGVFILASLLCLWAFNLNWNWQLPANEVIVFLVCLGAIIASDTLLHFLLWGIYREKYLAQYRQLVFYFEQQGPIQILSGGLLAGAEELVFRGVLLQGMVQLQVPFWMAIVISGFLFGLAHFINDSSLRIFGYWAIWEGAIIGAVYWFSGSLLISVLVHVTHDIGGFIVFAVQRKTGWLLGAYS